MLIKVIDSVYIYHKQLSAIIKKKKVIIKRKKERKKKNSVTPSFEPVTVKVIIK